MFMSAPIHRARQLDVSLRCGAYLPLAASLAL